MGDREELEKIFKDRRMVVPSWEEFNAVVEDLLRWKRGEMKGDTDFVKENDPGGER